MPNEILFHLPNTGPAGDPNGAGSGAAGSGLGCVCVCSCLCIRWAPDLPTVSWKQVTGVTGVNWREGQESCRRSWRLPLQAGWLCPLLFHLLRRHVPSALAKIRHSGPFMAAFLGWQNDTFQQAAGPPCPPGVCLGVLLNHAQGSERTQGTSLEALRWTS